MEVDYRLKSVISTLGADSKMVGILNIVMGVINILTISGIINGVILIIIGMKAKETGDRFQNCLAYNDEVEEYRAIESLAKYFWWMKIFFISTIVVFVVFLILSLVTGSMMRPRSYPYDYSL